MEPMLRGLVDTLPGLVWTGHPDGAAEYFNRRWCDYTGLRAEEACGHGWQAAVHPEDLPRLIDTWQAVTAAHESQELQVRVLHSDGGYRWFFARIAPLAGAPGQIVNWCAMNTELDDRVRAKEAETAHWWLSWATREIHFRSIADSIPVHASLMTPTGELELVNRQTLEYYGMTLEELRRAGTDIIHPDDRAQVLAATHKGDGSSLDYEARVRRADGVYRWFRDIGFPLRDAQGRVVVWYFMSLDIDDRKRAEEALRRSEALLAEAQRLSRIGSFFWDATADNLVWSEELYRIFELDPGLTPTLELFATRVHPDDSAALFEMIRQAEAGEPVYDGLEYGYRLRLPDGSVKHVLLKSYKFLGATGQTQYFGTIQDITARRRSDEALRRSEAFLAEAQHLSRMGSFLWTAATEELVWSAEMYRIAGVDPSVAPQRALFSSRVHPDDVHILREMEEDSRTESFGGREYEYRLVMPDGTAKYVAINSRKIYGEDGELQYLGAVQDVTERRVAGEKLRRSEVLLAEGQRLSRAGSFMWIPATDELVWSAEMYRITAIDPATPAARDLFDTRVHPDDAQALKDMQARAAAGAPDYDGREYEFRLLMPDHSIKYVIINSHMVHGADGQVQYVGALQDVTDRHAAEEALANARSELAHVARVTSLGGLTASITHEVSQPLSGIITNASTCQRMLAADPPNIEGARETVRRILRDGGRASDVITRLRGLFSKKAPVVEPVDLNETTREVIALSSTELQRNGVSLQQEFSDNLPPVEGDRVQLQQVILNLLLNAADAMSAVYDRPRQLTVRTDRDEHGQVRVSMRDTGVGFDPQTVGKLFEAFFTTKGNGMGIGLSVSRSIIEGHNGRLWAVANDGPGATFSFSIPCKSEGDVNVRRAIAS